MNIPIPVCGPGKYGSLSVTSKASLDGTLQLNFRNGYTPEQGDTFTFLVASAGSNDAFDSVVIFGLAPGFEYELSYVNGQLTLEALNDWVSLINLYFPRVAH